MALSPAGRIKFAVQAFLFLINIVVLALAARVNEFQEFFFAADLLPFGLSIATLVLLLILLTCDLVFGNPYSGRAQSQIAIFGVLSIFWLSFSAFSTSRWRQIPLKCDAIPIDFPDERTWCKDLQALKSFIWIEFLLCLITALGIARYAVVQHNRGCKYVWKMSLSRYRPQFNETVEFTYEGSNKAFEYGVYH